MVTCNIDGKILYHKIMEKLDNQKIFLFNKKCCKYFCDSISIGFTEEHLDLVFDLSHTLCLDFEYLLRYRNIQHSSVGKPRL